MCGGSLLTSGGRTIGEKGPGLYALQAALSSEPLDRPIIMFSFPMEGGHRDSSSYCEKHGHRTRHLGETHSLFHLNQVWTKSLRHELAAAQKALLQDPMRVGGREEVARCEKAVRTAYWQDSVHPNKAGAILLWQHAEAHVSHMSIASILNEEPELLKLVRNVDTFFVPIDQP